MVPAALDRKLWRGREPCPATRVNVQVSIPSPNCKKLVLSRDGRRTPGEEKKKSPSILVGLLPRRHPALAAVQKSQQNGFEPFWSKVFLAGLPGAWRGTTRSLGGWDRPSISTFFSRSNFCRFNTKKIIHLWGDGAAVPRSRSPDTRWQWQGKASPRTPAPLGLGRGGSGEAWSVQSLLGEENFSRVNTARRPTREGRICLFTRAYCIRHCPAAAKPHDLAARSRLQTWSVSDFQHCTYGHVV